MSIDNVVRILDAITRLLAAIVWPCALIILLIHFGPSLRRLVENVREFSLKAPGVEASGKLTEAAVSLGAASAARPETETSPEARSRVARDAVEVVSSVVSPRVLRRAERSIVLWVDDRPDNNIHERQSLEALGVRFVIATSTDEALDRLKYQPFDAIISDMGRPPDQQAGYTLLDKLRAEGNMTPYVIYAGSRAPEHQEEARKRGAVGCTNRPNELFEIVLSILGRQHETQ